MIALWRAIYNDGSFFIGDTTLKIDRKKLVGFDVLWGEDPNALMRFHIDVPSELRLVYRSRGWVSSNSSVTMDCVLVALESKDRSFVKLWVLYVENGESKCLEKEGWGGPNLWAPTLKEQEL